MLRREVVELALAGREVPYTPWSFGFTREPLEQLRRHLATEDLDTALANHLFVAGDPAGFFAPAGENRVVDAFGVVWDRSVDKDIGMVQGTRLPAPTLRGYSFPDPDDPIFWDGVAARLALPVARKSFRVYPIGFSLYERAWTLRGMENLMMDFLDHPEFVAELLSSIATFNVELVRRAVKLDIDAVYFGDDWGQQIGLQMGPEAWRTFLKPQLRRMYAAVRNAGRKVFIHSCGDVDEIFDDLIEIGVDCFNPFQPEVMDVGGLLDRYHGRLAFHGGLSTQRTLPEGTVDDVLRESRGLLARGLKGGYIFSPAHAVEGDVPLRNILAFVEAAREQPGFRSRG
ncbi:MAG: uroporphyrinogen-III decarboxylase-like protein [Verrucomicrobia bacterium]|nr:uroporphyrinogen-III decarboxylase-like protein [Verrucomicrobiota bacterium]